MKAKEELNALKCEVEDLNKKLSELSEEELKMKVMKKMITKTKIIMVIMRMNLMMKKPMKTVKINLMNLIMNYINI